MEKKLIPLIMQDRETKQVLSLFYCNEESVRLMRKTGFVWRFSRRAGKQLMKGATSGNVQKLVSLGYDCDRDALLAVVDQHGEGACHLKRWTCFGEKKSRGWSVLDELCEVLRDRRKTPRKNSYASAILRDKKKIAEKLVEEAGELAEAILKKKDDEVAWEGADLLFFTLAALESRCIDVQQVLAELKRRRRESQRVNTS